MGAKGCKPVYLEVPSNLNCVKFLMGPYFEDMYFSVQNSS